MQTLGCQHPVACISITSFCTCVSTRRQDQDHNLLCATLNAVPAPAGLTKGFCMTVTRLVPPRGFYKRRIQSGLACVIPLIIQTWDRGKKGVTISLLPFSVNQNFLLPL